MGEGGVAKLRRPGCYVGIIAYGVGITEALPVARAELEKGDVEQLTLLWAVRTADELFWCKEIQALQREHEGRFKFVACLSRQKRAGMLHGRITVQILRQVFDGAWGTALASENEKRR